MSSVFGIQSEVRTARFEDRNNILSLIENHEYYHHHLDWRSPIDWLGDQPFVILKSEGKDQAALACPSRPKGIGWIRLFVVSRSFPVTYAWQVLLSEAIRVGRNSDVTTLVGLGFMRWFCDLLESSGFTHIQDVIGLSLRVPTFPVFEQVGNFMIRQATEQDLPAIAALDGRAFDTLWQHPLPTLKDAFNQAGYVSVITSKDKIVGYQLSTCSAKTAHLARLAIDPHSQNRHLGRALIIDLLRYSSRLGMDHVTVNTQSDNQASLALYRKMGFELSDEKYPVYLLHISRN